ncbi:recombinase family protein [Paenarthrobacter ureafaciens]|uniref:recombinase family protein n=1 Tax=Paenarthrobacter ureafaciens TaxID=37931 RepID=UPI002DBF121A|nr:recombinase family protein [Paenarthrobacter ureafaciens]MEC3853466.1 recombinase family protein [Paenarthrobacter ureafaciens]
MASRTVRNAAIYTRISRDIEGKGLGVERQLQDCQKLAERMGLSVVSTYSDNDVSAYSGKKRPAYERMLQEIQNGHVQTVIAWNTDRLHRRTTELERYIDICQPLGVETHSVQAGHVDLSTANGRAVAKILGTIAQQESELKSERIQRQKLQAAQAGKYLGGRVPWGWQAKDGKIVEEPTAAAFIREGTQAILDGHSLIEVTRRWADGGAVSLSGTRMNTTQVRRILLRSRNAGIVTFHGEPVSSDWPALLSVEDFRALEAKLNDRSVPRQSAAKFKYLLSGIVACHCGEYVTGFGAAATAEKPQYRRMYRCRVHQQGGRYVRGHATREMHRLDNYVRDVIAAYLQRPDLKSVVLAAAADVAVGSTPAKAPNTGALLTRKQDLARLFAAGVIEESQLIEGTAQIRSELADIERQAVQDGGSSELVGVLLTADPGQSFRDAGTGIQRAVIRALADIQILEGKGVPGVFSPELIAFNWKGGN